MHKLEKTVGEGYFLLDSCANCQFCKFVSIFQDENCILVCNIKDDYDDKYRKMQFSNHPEDWVISDQWLNTHQVSYRGMCNNYKKTWLKEKRA